MSLGAGFAAGIGAGIAIGMSSGQQKGKAQVFDFLEQNEIALFDQEGKRILVEDLKQNSTLRSKCTSRNKAFIPFLIVGLIALAIGLVVYFLSRAPL